MLHIKKLNKKNNGYSNKPLEYFVCTFKNRFEKLFVVTSFIENLIKSIAKKQIKIFICSKSKCKKLVQKLQFKSRFQTDKFKSYDLRYIKFIVTKTPKIILNKTFTSSCKS